MEESHGEDLASHPDPESCAAGREASGEALTGAHAGQPSSREIMKSGVPTPLTEAEGNIVDGVIGKPYMDPARSETLCMRGNSLRWNREIPQVPVADGAAGRPEKVDDRTPGMHACGKSDGCIVPRKPPNKDELHSSAEAVEGRRLTEGNTLLSAVPRTQRRTSTSIGLQRVREAARRDRRARFTALLHHITIDLLRGSFYALKRSAAPGGGWSDVAAVRGRTRSSLARPACAGSQGHVPGATFATGLYSQERRPPCPLGIASLEARSFSRPR